MPEHEYPKTHVGASLDPFFGPRNCVVCGRRFTPKSNTNAMCCSPECSKEHQREMSHRVTKAIRVPYKNTCKRCGNKFETKYKTQTFCSKECKKYFKTMVAKAKRARKQKREWVTPLPRFCENCHEVFTPKREYLGQILRFCSKECRMEFNARNLSEKYAASGIRATNRFICHKVYHADENSVFYDPDFVEDLVGVTCQRVQERREMLRKGEGSFE